MLAVRLGECRLAAHPRRLRRGRQQRDPCPMRSLAETGPVLGRTRSRGRLVALSARSKLTFELANDRQFELLQHRQQMFGCLQICRIEAFHKLFEYRLQNGSRAIPLSLSSPQRRQVDRSAQFP
jgi:hypothetical protein